MAKRALHKSAGRASRNSESLRDPVEIPDRPFLPIDNIDRKKNVRPESRWVSHQVSQWDKPTMPP